MYVQSNGRKYGCKEHVCVKGRNGVTVCCVSVCVYERERERDLVSGKNVRDEKPHGCSSVCAVWVSGSKCVCEECMCEACA